MGWTLWRWACMLVGGYQIGIWVAQLATVAIGAINSRRRCKACIDNGQGAATLAPYHFRALCDGCRNRLGA